MLCCPTANTLRALLCMANAEFRKHAMCMTGQFDLSSGELGELAGKIIKGNPVREFDGYVNKAATQKKVLTDVFTKGDMAFMTGW